MTKQLISICGSPAYFLDNKYTRWYLELCTTRQSMVREDYTERHHIWPDSMGGPEDSENKVRLTAREHFVAHWLLIKMIPDLLEMGEHRRNLNYAISTFRTCNNPNMQRPKLNSKQYEVARKALSEALTGRIFTLEHRAAMSKSQTGKKHTAEHSMKVAIALQVCHKFYLLDQENNYTEHPDFYRYCSENTIGRANLQAAMVKHGVGVITAGKHKGKVFSFNDIGTTEASLKRDEFIALAKTNRKKGVTEGWSDRSREAPTAKGVRLLDPDGKEHSFRTLREMADATGKPSTSVQTAPSGPHLFTVGAWKGWTKL